MIQIGNNKVHRIMYRGTDDAARAILGGDWRLPTKDEFQELIDNTTRSIIYEGDNSYLKYESDNGKYIILPNYARYWSSSLENAATIAYTLLQGNRLDGEYRYRGKPIRAVSTTQGVDLGLSVRWADSNLTISGLATNPKDLGDFFAWGEIATKSSYTWDNYKFNPKGDKTMTKYNSQDGLTTLQLDCDCEYERVMEGGDFVFFKPIEYSKDFSAENLSLVSAVAVLDALLFPVGGSQTITFSSNTSELLLDDDDAIAKIEDLADIGWNIVLN